MATKIVRGWVAQIRGYWSKDLKKVENEPCVYFVFGQKKQLLQRPRGHLERRG